jgi:hypothetical protein
MLQDYPPEYRSVDFRELADKLPAGKGGDRPLMDKILKNQKCSEAQQLIALRGDNPFILLFPGAADNTFIPFFTYSKERGFTEGRYSVGMRWVAPDFRFVLFAD